VGFHWTLGGSQEDTVSWSMLAPQIALLTGAHVSEAAFLLLLCLSSYAAFLGAATILGPEAITPQHVPIPIVITALFEALNFLVPGCLTFAMMAHLIMRLKTHGLRLERNLQKAERLAHDIATLDLEEIVEADFHQERILEVLQVIARNLKLYRPYIPSHLMEGKGAEEEDDEPEPGIAMLSCPSDRSRSTESISQVGPYHGSTVLSSGYPSSQYLKARLPITETPDVVKELHTLTQSFSTPTKHVVTSLEHLQARKRGTLLYIRLHRLEDFADDTADPDCLGNVARAAALFAETVLTAVKQTKGVVYTMHHNECLVTWNFFTGCSMHAQNACHVALAIRKVLAQLQATSPRLPLSASMGVWGGSIICGSVGTQDYKAPSLVGHGVSRVVRLQRYAAASGRCIVANAEVQRGIALAPRSRLLPIDIIQFQSMRTADDYELGFPTVGTRYHLIYEVVEEILLENSMEWMYALQSTGGASEIDSQVLALLQQAQTGVQNRELFLTSLRALRQCGDKAVIQVCVQLEYLLFAGHLARPFCRVGFDRWTPEFVRTPSPRASAEPLHRRFDALATLGREVDLELPQLPSAV